MRSARSTPCSATTSGARPSVPCARSSRTAMNSSINLFAGWLAFFCGALSGALIGLRFHREDWLGGYNAFPRRMVRLGHIAFFGLGLINILFALSAAAFAASAWTRAASVLLVVGALTMPVNCFLTAWRGVFRHTFFIPAGATMAGILAFLGNWLP